MLPLQPHAYTCTLGETDMNLILPHTCSHIDAQNVPLWTHAHNFITGQQMLYTPLYSPNSKYCTHTHTPTTHIETKLCILLSNIYQNPLCCLWFTAWSNYIAALQREGEGGLKESWGESGVNEGRSCSSKTVSYRKMFAYEPWCFYIRIQTNIITPLTQTYAGLNIVTK